MEIVTKIMILKMITWKHSTTDEMCQNFPMVLWFYLSLKLNKFWPQYKCFYHFYCRIQNMIVLNLLSEKSFQEFYGMIRNNNLRDELYHSLEMDNESEKLLVSGKQIWKPSFCQSHVFLLFGLANIWPTGYFYCRLNIFRNKLNPNDRFPRFGRKLWKNWKTSTMEDRFWYYG